MLCAFGILMALFERAQNGGIGQIVESDMVCSKPKINVSEFSYFVRSQELVIFQQTHSLHLSLMTSCLGPCLLTPMPQLALGCRTPLTVARPAITCTCVPMENG